MEAKKSLSNSSFAFSGSPEFARIILEGLLNAGLRPSFVVTETDKPVGRQKTITPTPVKAFALKHNIPVFTPQNKQEITEIFTANTVDLSIVAAYGKIIPEEALNACPKGWINVHASLLPKYRGASPIQAAVLAGESHTGITFMKMDKGLDTGDIISYVDMPISPDDTSASLTLSLANLAVDTLPEVLELYLSGAITPKPQDNSLATTTTLISKSDGEVHLLADSPETLDRKFRAYHPWPGIFTNEFGNRLIIKEAHLQDNSFIITKLGFAGRNATDGKTWALAHKNILTKLPASVKLN